MTKILLVEDEEKLARFVELELTHEGYQVDKAFDGRIGLEMAEAGGYDLILLDIMLPGLNGLEVLRRLRRTSRTPVIMLTARDAVMDKVTGLDTGADDYVTKPFSIEELLARIRVALRKRGSDADRETRLSLADLTMDVARRRVERAGQEIELTSREFALLKYFLENKTYVLTREQLLETV
ncbi:MAG: response regulator transcription factor, partial [Clostridia bacterium]|nr:response regulator transcription factor [Clostridia bacterium]